jgi:hypothetical protein
LQFICKSIAICILGWYNGGTMSLRGKKSRSRWVAGLLLAVYGSAGVLGYGLHTVWECEHHCQEHAHTSGVVHEHHHDHSHGCHHHHNHGPVIAKDDKDVRGSLIAACDDCPICEFLVQAQSQFVMELAADTGSPVSTVATFGEHSYVAPLLGIHPARGPPLS